MPLSAEQLEAKNILEALLFSSAEPLALQTLHEIVRHFLPCTQKEVRHLLTLLQQEAKEEHAYELQEEEAGFIFKTKLIYRPYLEKLHGSPRPIRLSRAALEVLAIIQHKQPIQMAQIDAIRGVDSCGTLKTLLDQELIRYRGKPRRYSTTEKFDTHFS